MSYNYIPKMMNNNSSLKIQWTNEIATGKKITDLVWELHLLKFKTWSLWNSSFNIERLRKKSNSCMNSEKPNLWRRDTSWNLNCVMSQGCAHSTQMSLTPKIRTPKLVGKHALPRRLQSQACRNLSSLLQKTWPMASQLQAERKGSLR